MPSSPHRGPAHGCRGGRRTSRARRRRASRPSACSPRRTRRPGPRTSEDGRRTTVSAIACLVPIPDSSPTIGRAPGSLPRVPRRAQAQAPPPVAERRLPQRQRGDRGGVGPQDARAQRDRHRRRAAPRISRPLGRREAALRPDQDRPGRPRSQAGQRRSDRRARRRPRRRTSAAGRAPSRVSRASSFTGSAPRERPAARSVRPPRWRWRSGARRWRGRRWCAR